MSLEENHDLECTELDLTGIRLITKEEVERGLDIALRPTLIQRGYSLKEYLKNEVKKYFKYFR